MPSSRAHTVQSGGFTLVELLVVLAIMALMAATALPFVGRATAGAGLRAAGAELRASLQAARSDAVTQSRTVIFRGEPGGGFWLDRRHYPLGERTPLRVTVAGAGPIAFYPWGGSSGGHIRIETAHSRRDIDVDAVTGRAILRP